MNPATTATPPPTKANGCGCKGHHHGHAHDCACCDPRPFVRPRYFCGHLLTDADLRQDQQYFRARNRLYHRTLHGHGVVCGLKLHCHPRCDGHILVSEGYAIDPCGNDLVLDAPAAFDVMDWVPRHYAASGKHHAKPATKMPSVNDTSRKADTPKAGAGGNDQPCPDIQCYYVVACYYEEETDFTTPFVPGCQPAVAECEATRIREGVRIDLIDQLPPDDGWISALEKRLRKCVQLFTDDAFKDLQKPEVAEALADSTGSKFTVKNDKVYRDLYTHLWGALYKQDWRGKEYLQCNRSKLTGPEKTFPPAPPSREDDQKSADDLANYQKAVKDAFEELRKKLSDAYGAVQDCVAEALVFPCPTADPDACVVLGSVEVQDDKLVRVCNCPRAYVWSFANFFAVLAATLLGRRPPAEGDQCCPTYRWDNWEEAVRDIRQGWSADQRLLDELKSLEAITKNICASVTDVTLTESLAALVRTLDEKVTTELAMRDVAIMALSQRIATLERSPAGQPTTPPRPG